ncbi:spore coat protein [Sediminibacillus dalangtanensis]|uniref:Spore coat protein n=1 Tax=Sediminibacillus dalangtanensis TaxID=2729421 RepID=A0ABX7VRV3_9BACI|nr:spore coat protein [Sediminibacillus dalangtanensis]QTM98300.1 spore coat protein [Sediminibacillus dalangtanensis]
MASNKLALHETLEVHEILTLKQSAILKAYAMKTLVEDDTLKQMLDNEVNRSEKAIKELEEVLGQ